MGHIYFVGDSITAGAWDDRGGWVSRVIGTIMQKVIKADADGGSFYCLPYNLGVSGDTVADILPRIKAEISTRRKSDGDPKKVQIVFDIGTNDSVYLIGEDRPKFTDEDFRSNLEKLIKISKEISANISFVGLIPVNDDILNPIPWAPEKAYANKYVKNFENIISAVCKENNIPFLPMFERWIAMSDYKDHLIDGAHPNSKGHALLAKQIEDFVVSDDFVKFHSS